MNKNNFGIEGLSKDEVASSRKKDGANSLEFKKENGFLEALKSLLKEPMILLLLATSIIYFVSGKYEDGIFMILAIVLVATISLYQDSRSRNALEKLKNITQPNCKVIREGKIIEIPSIELVIGDYLMIEEGTSIAADGKIFQSNDFSVNESILTGESMPVFKDSKKEDNLVFQGTSVASGLAIVVINAIGNNTKLGNIGKSLEKIVEEKTPLETQISNFVKYMVIAGAIVFAIVWIVNYIHSKNILDSLLKALTLAMSILPEEIPVAFTTFMALGAWRLMKLGIVVKQMKTVETLGSATVICTDKTGTITENKMSLAKIYSLKSNKIVDYNEHINNDEIDLITIAMWASEPIPFDPMEIALHGAYQKVSKHDERTAYSMIHEYPLGGKPPMMTHIFEDKNKKRIIATKGAAEAILEVCNLSAEQKTTIQEAINTITKEGYRVLGVATCTTFNGTDFPKQQQEFNFEFSGLVSFYDPPKKNIQEVLNSFYEAGIKVKIITGDNALTTTSIAKQIQFKGYEKSISGDELMKLDDDAFQKQVVETNIFTRMYPEAKLRIINALKANHEIVAMTGDGVNDGPALKTAHIGIAMGKRGTEIAKQASSLILVEDDLARMVDAVAMGRKIYTNLKKAIQYIISIHIPIIFIPLILGWIYPNIFSPLHIIFLELIMGPTCSIIYENEPMEKNTMQQKPRALSSTFFNIKELATSIVQGLFITIGTLLAYQYALYMSHDESTTRTIVFTTLISSNIFLTLSNRSFYYSIFTTLFYKNNLIPIVIGITILITALTIYIKPISTFFEFSALGINQILISISIGFVFVIWYELVKIYKRLKGRKSNKHIQHVYPKM